DLDVLRVEVVVVHQAVGEREDVLLERTRGGRGHALRVRGSRQNARVVRSSMRRRIYVNRPDDVALVALTRVAGVSSGTLIVRTELDFTLTYLQSFGAGITISAGFPQTPHGIFWSEPGTEHARLLGIQTIVRENFAGPGLSSATTQSSIAPDGTPM